MEDFHLKGTENTPEIALDHNGHQLSFNGESRPEDVRKFYTPVLEWLDSYKSYLYYIIENAPNNFTITCNFKMEYFNSSSAKYFMDIINKLKEINAISEKIELKVNWYYEEMDEDMQDAGEEFEEMVELPFNYIAVEEEG